MILLILLNSNIVPLIGQDYMKLIVQQLCSVDEDYNNEKVDSPAPCFQRVICFYLTVCNQRDIIANILVQIFHFNPGKKSNPPALETVMR